MSNQPSFQFTQLNGEVWMAQETDRAGREMGPGRSSDSPLTPPNCEHEWSVMELETITGIYSSVNEPPGYGETTSLVFSSLQFLTRQDGKLYFSMHLP